MIKYCLNIVLVFSTLFVNGQITEDLQELADQQIKTRYKTFVFENLDLTKKEIADFEPVFNKYLVKKQEVHSERIQILTRYANNYQYFTDKDVISNNKRLRTIENKERKLGVKYYKEFRKVLPLKKANSYFLIDRLLKDEMEYKALNYILSKIRKE
ncbi:MAG: hypothetical protein ACK5MD_00685 [Flavobacteriales bacterium]